jgi:hypothetical protein
MTNRACCLFVVIAGLTLATTGFAATTTVITGGDAGQGLTLDSARVVSALNVQGASYSLQGVNFTPQAQGAQFSGTIVFGAGENSANDDAMRGLIDQLAFVAESGSLNFAFSSLTPNASYRLDLIQSTLNFNSREQAIVVNGQLITLVTLTAGVAYNTSFDTTANGSGVINLNVVASATYGGTGFQDGVVMNGIVLTAIPEPGSYAALLGFAAMAWSLGRRRRAA